MYTQNNELLERIAIVEKMMLKQPTTTQKLLVPDNKAEIMIPISKDLEIKMIGSMRSLSLRRGFGFFITPRPRGLEILNAGEFLLFKISPIYAKSFLEALPEKSTGIYEMSLQEELIQALLSAYHKDDTYEASDLLEYFMDNEKAYSYNTTILDSMEMIINRNGSLSIKEIYSALNVSKSKLEQHFNKEIGLTPKEFCKIEKMNTFIGQYEQNQHQSLTELTYKCGYYDQSHLIKDFKYFLNISPRKFLNGV